MTTTETVPKTCFNGACNNVGTHWINIIGRFGGYEGGLIPYCVCDDCNGGISIREQFMQKATGQLQDKGCEVKKEGIDIKSLNPFTVEKIITTKDLHELLFQSGIPDMDEITNPETGEKDVVVVSEPFELVPKVCYNSYCNNEASHLIDVINTTVQLGDHEVPYRFCDECYSFFEYRRKEPLVFPSVETLYKPLLDLVGAKTEENYEKVSGINPLSNREVITTEDLYRLLLKTQEAS